ncbi:enoyl-CoA hydratase/isomerase family protein [Salinisphaera sp. T31B1]|uniref:enoyl-CoA hydratase/isomerase family protein n=1 Tax=Salinisphaera sp. T31B1 TaxID=727963 RepID=UPI003341E144
MSEFVQSSVRDGIAHVRLNRPDVLNAMHAPMRDAFIACLAGLNEEPAVAAVVITGAGGRAFSAGQDLDEAVGFAGAARIEAWMRHQGAVIAAVRNMDKPVVAGFNGVATGVGFQIGLAADWRVAYPEARLGQPEVKVGLASIYGSWLMSLHLGLAANQALSLTGDLIDGRRAAALGLVNELVDPAAVEDTAFASAQRMAGVPATAVRLTKARFRQQSQADFEATCDAAVAAQIQAYAGGEPQQRMQAFIDARRARASG